MPDRRLAWAPDAIAPRCRVEWPGVEWPDVEELGVEELGAEETAPTPAARPPGSPLRVLWASRWEHDKDPETLIAALERVDPAVALRVSILGQRFADTPAVFDRAPARLGERLADFGFVERTRYHEILRAADLVVSTARHEFFGLAVVEAVLAGARPLLPDRLAYPELLAAAGCRPERARQLLWTGGPDELAGRIEAVARELGDPASGAQAQRERDELRAGFRVFGWDRRLPALDGGLERVAPRTAQGRPPRAGARPTR
jgi:glycosyltransferase involved in cell wall biosynthesis